MDAFDIPASKRRHFRGGLRGKKKSTTKKKNMLVYYLLRVSFLFFLLLWFGCFEIERFVENGIKRRARGRLDWFLFVGLFVRVFCFL